MSRLFQSVVAVGAVLFSMSLQAAISLPVGNGETVDLYSKSYALVIGVSDYEHWPDLPGVEEDITAVGKGLKKHGFKVISLLNPTRASFDNTMRNFIGDHGQDPENRLIIYYAGHGHTLKTNRGRELGYIVPVDAPLPKDGAGAFKKKAISMLEVEIFAKQMESKHAMFTFDSCFSGSLFEITRAVPDTISLKTSEPVRQFITAGSAEQTVPDKSVFRNQFVAGLEGEADVNKDGFITGTELAQYIEESVTNYTRRAQTPQYGKIRDPYLDKGDFVFINPRMEITINVPGKEPVVNNATDPASVEITFWNTIKGSKDPDSYQVYLDEYPEGKFRKLAELLIKQAGKQAEQAQALKAEREEEERKLAELRQTRSDEFKRQQKILEQQQLDNEQRMATFKAEQESLSKQREEEEARLKGLLEQQKIAFEKQQTLAKTQQQVASMAPSLQSSGIHFIDKDIAFIALAEGQTARNFVIPVNGRFVNKAEYSQLVSERMLPTLYKRGYNKSRIKIFTDPDFGKKYSYESNDYEVGDSICKEQSVDTIIAVLFEDTGSSIGEPIPADYVLYDCKQREKVMDSYLSGFKSHKDDTVPFEKHLKRHLKRFLDEFDSQ